MNYRIRKKISNRLGFRSYKLYKAYLKLSKVDPPHILIVDYTSRINGYKEQVSQTQLKSLFNQLKELANDVSMPILPRDRCENYMPAPNDTIVAPGESNMLAHQNHIPIRMLLQNSTGGETQVNMCIIKSRQSRAK